MFIPENYSHSSFAVLEQLISKALNSTVVPTGGEAHTLEAAVLPFTGPLSSAGDILIGTPVSITLEGAPHPVGLVNSGAITGGGESGTLIGDVLAVLGEAKSLGIFPVTMSGAGELKAGFVTALQSLGGQLSVGTLEGTPDLAGGFATLLSSIPDDVWTALVSQAGALSEASVPAGLVQGFLTGLPQFDADAVIKLVGVDVLDVVPV